MNLCYMRTTPHKLSSKVIHGSLLYKCYINPGFNIDNPSIDLNEKTALRLAIQFKRSAVSEPYYMFILKNSDNSIL